MPISQWGFQAPWMLLAALALAIPIAIHFLSKSKGKRILFGDIRLIPHSKPVRMTQVRLVEALLLLLRLLLLMMTILLLAKFYWIQDSQNNETIALVTPDWLNYASELQKQALIDRSMKKPTTAQTENNVNPRLYKRILLLDKEHIKAINHHALTEQNIVNWPASSINSVDALSINNTWLLVENMTKTISKETHIEVYTTNTAKEFFGEKINAKTNVAWNILPVGEQLNSASAGIKEQLTAINIAIIGNQFSHDSVRNVVKALDLIQRFSMEKLSVKTYENLQGFIETEPGVKVDWIINLKAIKTTEAQEQALTNRLAKGSRLLVIEPMTSQNTYQSIDNIDRSLFADENFHAKTIDSASLKLRQKTIEQGEIYKLDETAINWNTLINQPQFPQQLLSLLLRDKNSILSLLTGHLSHEQISSAVEAKSLLPEEELLAFSSVHYIKQKIAAFSVNQTWLMLVFLLWIFERLLSELSITGKQRFGTLSKDDAAK